MTHESDRPDRHAPATFRRVPRALRAGVCALALLLAAPFAHAATPRGWTLSGKDPSAYELALDTLVAHTGLSSARLSSVRPSREYGSMLQTISAAPYRGKRVRLSAWLKSRDVDLWCGAWMRVDGSDYQSVLAFDNMMFRAVRGTTDWTRCSIVLDVASEARVVTFGLNLQGRGTVWMDDAVFEVVGPDVPTTNMLQAPYRPAVKTGGR